MANTDFPFPYVGHGVAAARKTMTCFVCFAGEVPKGKRAAIQSGIPSPLAGFFKWTKDTVLFGNDDDSLSWVVRATYGSEDGRGGEARDAEWEAFNAELHAWAKRVHCEHPILFVFQPIDEEYSTVTDAWHEWSLLHAPHAIFTRVPPPEKKRSTVGEHVAATAAMYKEWVLAQPFERQKEIVAALSEGERGALKALRALPKPRPLPVYDPEPTRDECEKLWRGLAAAADVRPIDKRFEESLAHLKLRSPVTLGDHYYAMDRASAHDAAIELARAAVAHGEFPAHWRPRLIRSLIATDRLDEATALVGDALWDLQSYQPEVLTSLIALCRAMGRTEEEELLFHAGEAFFTSSFAVDDEWRRGYSKEAPPDIADRFATWLLPHIEPRLRARTVRTRDLAHWSVWFDAIASKVFSELAEHVGSELARRARTLEALVANTDPGRVAELGAAVLELPGEADVALRAAWAVHRFDRKLACTLYRHAIAAEWSSAYKNRDFFSLLYNLIGMSAGTPEVGEAIALAEPWANDYPKLHYNIACMAARRGDSKAALAHLREAVARGVDNASEIHADNDFALLRGTPDFEALFAPAAAAKPKSRARRNAPSS
jgi:hypothetical protein